MSGPEIVVAGPSDRASIEALDRAVQEATGHPALGDAVWRDLATPASDSTGFLARDGDRVVGYLHVARSDTFTPQHWALGLARLPGDERAEATGALLRSGFEHVAAHGGGEAILWVFDPSAADEQLFDSLHLTKQRDLYQMRVALPLAEVAKFPADVEVRAFEPGHDEAAWLDVNNRAFANHPEQGGWIRDTLARRMAEPWFDPSFFLLAFDADGLAGFNWLKVHGPELGEIFVIGVDPDRQSRGLGRALAVAGLAKLAAAGIRTGTLFVAADNAGALALYRALGFAVTRVDRAYAREVGAR